MKMVRDAIQAMSTFQRTVPAAETMEEIGDKMDTVVLIDLKILSRCWKSSMA